MGNNLEEYCEKHIDAPVVSIDENKHLVIHSHINMYGKMVLSKADAALLLIELYNFIKS